MARTTLQHNLARPTLQHPARPALQFLQLEIFLQKSNSKKINSDRLQTWHRGRGQEGVFGRSTPKTMDNTGDLNSPKSEQGFQNFAQNPTTSCLRGIRSKDLVDMFL
jgi:hypothetical protein